MEAGKSKVCRVDWQAGDPGEPVFQSEFEGSLLKNQEEPKLQMKSIGSLLKNSHLQGVVNLFVLSRPLTDWMSPTHIMQSHVLYSKPTNLNVNLIQKHPHRNTQNNVWPNIWASHGPAKLIHKIKHHTHNGILRSLKRKEILSHATAWMNLQDIMLSEINQSQKDKYCMNPHM